MSKDAVLLLTSDINIVFFVKLMSFVVQFIIWVFLIYGTKNIKATLIKQYSCTNDKLSMIILDLNNEQVTKPMGKKEWKKVLDCLELPNESKT